MKSKKKIVYIISLILIFLIFLVSMNIGYIKLSPKDTLRTLFGRGTEETKLILFDFRLPRILISLLVGSGLALSGCIIQGISKNPLADPGLLGINSGGGLMVILYVIFWGSKSFLSIFTLPFLAFLGASGTAAIIYKLSYKKDRGFSSLSFILTGVAVQAGISALTTILVIKLDETQFNFVANWQVGSIWASNWKFVLVLLPWILVLIPYVISKAKVLDILNLGEETAKSLGVSVEKERRSLLMASVALAASCVSVSGNISFVGLLAPHLSRKLVGPRHDILLATCAFIGAILVSIADTFGRWVLQPSEIPTGIVVAVIGAPYFIYLLKKGR